MESEKKNELDNLLLSYNLINIINFPTRIQNISPTAIDNIFMNVSEFESYTVTHILNVLSDHDCHLLVISTDYSHIPIQISKTIRKIIKYIMSDFLNKLNSNAVSAMFDSI